MIDTETRAKIVNRAFNDRRKIVNRPFNDHRLTSVPTAYMEASPSVFSRSPVSVRFVLFVYVTIWGMYVFF